MVCVAQIGAAHGVRGAFRVRCFTERAGERRGLRPVVRCRRRTSCSSCDIIGPAKGGVIARVDGHQRPGRRRGPARHRASTCRATVCRPPDDDEFYHEDLVGLAARDRGGRELGRVTAVLNFGAGDILEIATGDGGSELVPFTREAVPVIDIAGRLRRGRAAGRPLPVGEAAA